MHSSSIPAAMTASPNQVMQIQPVLASIPELVAILVPPLTLRKQGHPIQELSPSILPMEMPHHRISLQVLLIPEDSPSIPMTQFPFRIRGLGIPEGLYLIQGVMMARSRVELLTRVVSFSIRGVQQVMTIISLNLVLVIPIVSCWIPKMMTMEPIPETIMEPLNTRYMI